jgi:hypothetical protein
MADVAAKAAGPILGEVWPEEARPAKRSGLSRVDESPRSEGASLPNEPWDGNLRRAGAFSGRAT